MIESQSDPNEGIDWPRDHDVCEMSSLKSLTLIY